ncbi:MAG TPA: hypothetical protein VGG74_13860 [Kofleriaceae bacterium]|jgi:hypothetical protein
MARIGWIGIAIVATGAAGASLGAWYYVHVRPEPGAVIDRIDVGHDESLVIRAEKGGDRSFVELRDHDIVKWQALIPHYVGTHERPALAWSPTSVTFRVQRGPRAEVFALAMDTALKLGGFRLAPEHEPNTTPERGPITLTDHERSYELIGGPGWHQLVAVDLRSGTPVWQVELGAAPITDGGVQNGVVWVIQSGAKRSFDVHTGSDASSGIHS